MLLDVRIETVTRRTHWLSY